jgi:hypothetical protein
MKNDEIAKDTLLLIFFITILFVWQLALFVLAHHKICLRFHVNKPS